jgi:hypothetical protein
VAWIRKNWLNPAFSGSAGLARAERGVPCQWKECETHAFDIAAACAHVKNQPKGAVEKKGPE